MPVNMDEETSLDLTLSQEENLDWEALVAGVYEMGGAAFKFCQPSCTCVCDCNCGC
jgi:hypothetical protein